MVLPAECPTRRTARAPRSVRSAGRAGPWHGQDSGRGLRYEHFTQNEDVEKLAKPNLVIGKFGVGLKDAMATFDRHKSAC